MVMTPLLGVCLGFGTLEGVVDIQHGQVIAILVSKQVLHLIRTLALRVGANEDLRNGQKSRDRQDFVRTVKFG